MIKKLKLINDLEKALYKVQNNKIDFSSFIKFFLKNEIVIPSITKINNGAFLPVLFNKEAEKMMSAFTSVSLLNLYKKEIKEYMILSGRSLLGQIPEGYGLVINPGYDLGFDISSRGIKSIIHDFFD